MEGIGDGLLQRHGAGRTRLAIEQRNLAETLARSVDVQCHLLAGLAQDEDADRPGLDEIEGLPWAILVEQDHSLAKSALAQMGSEGM